MTASPGPRPSSRHGTPDDRSRPDQWQRAPRQQGPPQTRQAPSVQPPSAAPQPPSPVQPPPPRGDSGAVRVLRVVAYVLTSLASLVFLVLVVYGAVKLNQLQDALSSNPLFGGSSSLPSLPSQGDICAVAPDAPGCTAAND